MSHTARLMSATTRGLVIVGCLALLAAACSTDAAPAAETASPVVPSEPSATPTPDDQEPDDSAGDLFDAGVVHSVAVEFDQSDYDAMIDTYQATGDKEWIEASVTIDGEDYRQVGLRLKGNSSLMGLGRPVTGPGNPAQAPPSTTPASSVPESSLPSPDSASPTTAAPAQPGNGFPMPENSNFAVGPDEPERLPWLIRIDRFIEDQNHQGVTELVVRSSTTETALNEAVALDLLDEAGLATQQAIFSRFTVNDSDQVLRLVIEHPDDRWTAENLGDGNLYKAEASGDYSYRGADPAAYDDVFDQDAGEDDLGPLIEFLQFVNEADDETFAAELSSRLDIESFATYLAIQDLFQNFDDIDGPGNNSYLYYDPTNGRFTVVAWDHNFAFATPGGFPTQGGQPGEMPPFDPSQLPTGVTLPGNIDPSQLPEGGVPEGFGQPNVLTERFRGDPEFAAMIESENGRLRAALFDSGVATSTLDSRSSTLLSDVTDLVAVTDIEAEAESVATYFVAE
jgi:spore coat protein CotH